MILSLENILYLRFLTNIPYIINIISNINIIIRKKELVVQEFHKEEDDFCFIFDVRIAYHKDLVYFVTYFLFSLQNYYTRDSKCQHSILCN